MAVCLRQIARVMLRFVKAVLCCCFFALVACDGDGGIAVATVSPFQPGKLSFGLRAIGQTHRLETQLTSDADHILGVIDIKFSEDVDGVFSITLENGDPLMGAALPENQSIKLQVLFVPLLPKDYASTLRVVTEDRVFELKLSGSGQDLTNTDLVLMPSSIDFSSVVIGTTLTKEIEIKNIARAAQNITEVRVLSSRRAVSVEQSTFWVTDIDSETALANRRIGPRGTIKLLVHFRPRSVGDRMETLQLMTADKGFAALEVSGNGDSGGRLDCVPEGLDFGDVSRGFAVDLLTECEVKDGVFRIESISLEQGSDANFSLVAFPVPGRFFDRGDKLDLTLRFSGSGLASTHTGAVLIKSTHNSQTRIALTGTVTPSAKNETALTVSLQWDTSRTDFDLHLIRDGGTPFEILNDCYFREKNPDWGQAGLSLDDPFLDRDDVNNGGPEEINLAAAGESQYDVYVHFYGTEAFAPTSATVRVEFFGRTALTESRLFNACGEMWKVAVLTGVGAIAQAQFVDTVADFSSAGMCP
jgi:hypothetical protein